MTQPRTAESTYAAEYTSHALSDPMATKEYEVEQTLRTLMASVKDLDALRTSNEGRGILCHPESIFDLDLSCKKLSRILADVRGVS